MSDHFAEVRDDVVDVSATPIGEPAFQLLQVTMYSILMRRIPLPHIQNDLSPSFSSKHPQSERPKMNSSPRLPGCQLASLPENRLEFFRQCACCLQRINILRGKIANHDCTPPSRCPARESTRCLSFPSASPSFEKPDRRPSTHVFLQIRSSGNR